VLGLVAAGASAVNWTVPISPAIAVLLRRRWRHKLLYNQRGPILATALRLRTKALIAKLGIPID
jgi:hypothetical protein